MHTGRSPVVLYDPADPTFRQAYLAKHELCPGTLLDVLESYRFLWPSFLYLGLSRMTRAELSALFRDACDALNLNSLAFNRQTHLLYGRILTKTGNRNMAFYYMTTQLFLQLTICLENNPQQVRDELFGLGQRLWRWFARTLRLFLLSQEKIRRSRLAAATGWYLDQVVHLLGLDERASLRSRPLSVFGDLKAKYLSVGFDLLQKIYDGSYRTGDFLPSDAAAAAEYGVAVLTARKAYKMLNEMGFAKTVPQVGTQVVFNCGEMPPPQFLQDSPARVRNFLDCLTFVNACIRGVALHACRDLEALTEEFARLGQKIDKSPAAFEMYNLVTLLDCLVRHTHNITFCTYFSLIKPVLFFGAYRLQAEIRGEGLLQGARDAIACLEKGDPQAFANGLSNVAARLADGARAALAGDTDAPEPESPLFLSLVNWKEGGREDCE